jgi:hypothetical protein
MKKTKIVFALATALAFSGCGGGGSSSSGGGNLDPNFDCVLAGYNSDTGVNNVLTCNQTASLTLPYVGYAQTFPLTVYINGQPAAYDVVILQSVNDKGYFGTAGTTMQEVHLDANGTGTITYTAGSTGTDSLTIKSTLLSNGTATEQEYDTTTYTITIN